MVRDKPVISLSMDGKTNSPSIRKYLTQNVSEGNYEGLLRYMADKEGDNYNEPLESRDELRISSQVSNWLDDGEGNLSYKTEDEKLHPINLEDRVGDTIQGMFQRKSLRTDDGDVDYDFADLVYRNEEVGGR